LTYTSHDPEPASKIVKALTVDVEEYDHAIIFAEAVRTTHTC